LRPGDFLMSLNEEDITSTRQVDNLLATIDTEEGWDLSIDRNGRIGVLPTRYLPRESRSDF